MIPGSQRRGQPVPGPVGIRSIGRRRDGKIKSIDLPNGNAARNHVRTKRVLDGGVASTVQSLLEGVVKSGTGQRAQLADVPVAGKTGTTENYGDAWFVGWTPDYTVAVWVGYPNKLVPMTTEFNGEPVAGGTFPAGIWKTFMESVIKIDPPKAIRDKEKAAEEAAAASAAPATTTAPAPAAPSASTPAPQSGTTAPAPSNPTPPKPQAPTQAAPAQPAPTTPKTPSSGGGTAPSGGAAPPGNGQG
jgi:penicillin-binding protein 1A